MPALKRVSLIFAVRMASSHLEYTLFLEIFKLPLGP